MAEAPLMPKATAVWLVENTTLTFEQIADFCKLHPLEVKGIADGEVAQGIKGLDPITTGQLTREEIDEAQKDPSHKLRVSEKRVALPETKPKKRVRATRRCRSVRTSRMELPGSSRTIRRSAMGRSAS